MSLRRFSRTWLYVLAFLMALHSTLVIYSNSSYLEKILPNGGVGLVYSFAGLACLVGVFSFNGFTRIVGTFRTSIIACFFGLAALLALSVDTSPTLVVSGFIVLQICITLLYLCFDVFLEQQSQDKSTGLTRGIFLTTINVAYLIGPIIGGGIVDKLGFGATYLVSFAVLWFTLICIAVKLHEFRDRFHKPLNFYSAIRRIRSSKNIRGIIGVYLSLYIFYAFMVIYIPLYMSEVAGYSFSLIGTLIMIALIPFVLFQTIIGRLADTRYGEKEFIVYGLCLIAVTTLVLPSVVSIGFWAVATTLFIGRCGAAAIEVCADTYFFKHVDETEVELITTYRSVMYIALFLVPLVSGLILFAFGWLGIFICASIAAMLGIAPALSIKDTR